MDLLIDPVDGSVVKRVEAGRAYRKYVQFCGEKGQKPKSAQTVGRWMIRRFKKRREGKDRRDN